MGTIPKQAVLYMHKTAIDYDCDDCLTFIPSTLQCAQHSAKDRILPHGACGLWSQGTPLPGLTCQAAVTKLESGYAENKEGFGCRRCSNWIQDSWDCRGVNKDSAGDDPGLIHPDACCNAWQPDFHRATLSDQALEALGVYKPKAKEW